MILRGGEPFFYRGGSHGVLLVHGFTSAPAEMLLLGCHLHDLGYTVLGIRLAGHGTSPKDLARMSREDWYDSVCDGYALLDSCCERVSVAGQSMGGLLSLKLAANVPVHSVAAMAAPIFIHEDKRLYRLPPREECEGRFHPKRRRQLPDVPEECNASYLETPLVSVHEVLDLIESVKKELPRVKPPVLLVQSYNDRTVRYRSANYIYRRIGSREKELHWLDRSGHLLTLDCQREEVFQRVAAFLEEY